MSLKAKIEAIIYAAEEPVTLAQLHGLLGSEAQAILEERAARQGSLSLPEVGEIPLPSEPDLLNEEVLTRPEFADEQVDDAQTLPGDPDTPVASPSSDKAASPGAEAVSSAPEDTSAGPPDNDERAEGRKKRERDRAVRELLREQLDELIRDYALGDRGLEIREVASGFRLATRPEYHDAVRGFARSLKPPLKLSLQALETLAVVAYKQPVTAPEVAEIRGVDSGGVLGSLMARKLVMPAGRKQVVGRPILYRTTKEFLLRFGLRDVNELPSIEEFEKLAGELAEPLQEEMAMGDQGEDVTGANLREGEVAAEPQADGDPEGQVLEALPVDGRVSGMPPAEESNPSEEDAIIQSGGAATEGTED